MLLYILPHGIVHASLPSFADGLEIRHDLRAIAHRYGIIDLLFKGAISVRKAQSLTGIDAGDYSRVRNADFRRISVERLMAMLNGLGSRIDVKVKVWRGASVEHAATA